MKADSNSSRQRRGKQETGHAGHVHNTYIDKRDEINGRRRQAFVFGWWEVLWPVGSEVAIRFTSDARQKRHGVVAEPVTVEAPRISAPLQRRVQLLRPQLDPAVAHPPFPPCSEPIGWWHADNTATQVVVCHCVRWSYRFAETDGTVVPCALGKPHPSQLESED